MLTQDGFAWPTPYWEKAMKEFFKVTDLETVINYCSDFARVGIKEVPLSEAVTRILAEDIVAGEDLPDFPRTIVDGYAVQGASTFGASEGNPAYLTVKGNIDMGQSPKFKLTPGQAAKISTGGMVPQGADSVVMIEHTESIDDKTIEVYRSVAPGQNMIAVGEDIQKHTGVLSKGQVIRPQEAGLLAALGKEQVSVYRRPVVGIISTGDEIIPINATPHMGQIRDINTYTLAGQIREAGAVAVPYGIVSDDFEKLFEKCELALNQSDMVLISGGSSVGTRDFTVDVLSNLESAEILVHGISISPGKPTILAKVNGKSFWGMPGHVASAMIVFSQVVRPFVEHLAGHSVTQDNRLQLQATLSRNVASKQGRVDFIRVHLRQENDGLYADPVLGKSGLISTMVNANGLIQIDINTEGLDQGALVEVIPM